MNYREAIATHYERCWSATGESMRWSSGPVDDLPADFTVLRFPPSAGRPMSIDATAGMSQPEDDDRLEIHVFSPTSTSAHVELMTVIAHFHRTGTRLGLGHTINFGRPWLPGSKFTYGVLSLSYLDGPSLEVLELEAGKVRFAWLVPITEAEMDFEKSHGLDALEQKLEGGSFDYIAQLLPSVV